MACTQQNQSCMTRQLSRRRAVLRPVRPYSQRTSLPQDSQRFSNVTQDGSGRRAHSCPMGRTRSVVGEIAMSLKSKLGTNGRGEHDTADADALRLARPHFNQHAIEIQPYGTTLRYPIALDEKIRVESISILNQLLADTMTLRDLYKKHHWQVSGATFHQLHLPFDKHFDEQVELVDAVAERIGLLGGLAVAMAADVAEMSKVERPPKGREEVPVQISRL